MKGIKDMSEKNICQNPKCCQSDSLDRWNKKIDKYQSRKAKYKPRVNEYYRSVILEYFCTTSCAWNWAENNLENIIERKDCPNKILEKIVRQ